MILVILGIGLILLIAGIVFCCIQKPTGYNEKHTFRTWIYDHDWTYYILNSIGGVLAIVALIPTLILGVEVSSLNVIDDQIVMYQEENTRIEEQIATTVDQYQKYETEIFTGVKPESSITLVALYPELKSDTLVQKQIEVYTENNKKIKELKEAKITGSVKRWWLYFGK